jgi:polysaccharide biosynthesis PFTS motif protein
MRGYRLLKKNRNISKIKILEEALIETKIIPEYKFRIIGAKYFSLINDKFLREYISCRLVNNKFRFKLLCSTYNNSKIVYPLPLAWIRTIEEHEFKVAKFRSLILWFAYISFMFFFGIFKFVKNIYGNIISSDIQAFSSPYVLFLNLNSGNILKKDNNSKFYTITNWWLNWADRNKKVKSLVHSAFESPPIMVNNVSIVGSKNIFPRLKGVYLFIIFIYKSLSIIFFSFINIFFGSWYYIFTLEQIADSLHVEHLKSNELALEYFFHNSDWRFRPLWTYRAESMGAKIWMYFYSTNSAELIEPKLSRLDYKINPYKTISWKCFLVWDSYQANFLKATLGNKIKCRIVEPIWFNDSDVEIPKISSNAVIVFDVEPFRNSANQLLCFAFDYYNSINAIKFIDDIYEVLTPNKLSLVLKRKRLLGRNSSKSYQRKLDSLAKKIKIIDSTISPFRLIKDAGVVISMPYTSTAVIAKNYGVTSLYYDPTKLLPKDDPCSHGIPVISGKNELILWFENYRNNTNSKN